MSRRQARDGGQQGGEEGRVAEKGRGGEGARWTAGQQPVQYRQGGGAQSPTAAACTQRNTRR